MKHHHHHGREGCMRQGKGCLIKESVSIDLTGNIEIGSYVDIADDAKILTHKHNYRNSRRLRRFTSELIVKDLQIGDDVFIGVNAIIICVSKIGVGVVIGAGAVVTKDIGDYEIWAGNPARKVGER